MADTRSGADRARRPALRAEHATAAFVVLALASVIAAFAWSWHVEHAVPALPGQAGSEALRDGLRDLTDNCLTNSTIEGPLRRHCLEQAEIVSQSPDCTADCQAIARSVSSRANH